MKISSGFFWETGPRGVQRMRVPLPRPAEAARASAVTSRGAEEFAGIAVSGCRGREMMRPERVLLCRAGAASESRPVARPRGIDVQSDMLRRSDGVTGGR